MIRRKGKGQFCQERRVPPLPRFNGRACWTVNLGAPDEYLGTLEVRIPHRGDTTTTGSVPLTAWRTPRALLLALFKFG